MEKKRSPLEVIAERDKIPIRFDTTSNAIKTEPGVRKALEKDMGQFLINKVPEIIDRQAEVNPYITNEVGFYTNLMEEAKVCYEFGLFYSTIAMVGIAAERLAIELSERMKYSINGEEIDEGELFDKKDIGQYRRLRLLKKAGLLTDNAFNNLDEIRSIRNKYIHPTEIMSPKEESLKVLNKFIDTIQFRFSRKYEFRNGKIVARYGISKYGDGVSTYG